MMGLGISTLVVAFKVVTDATMSAFVVCCYVLIYLFDSNHIGSYRPTDTVYLHNAQSFLCSK